MKRFIFITITVMIVMIVLAAMFLHGGSEKFIDLTAKPDQITKLELSLPSQGNYKSTTNKAKIRELMDYLNGMDYEKIRGEPSYLPMKASMLYLHENDQVNFIVLFEDKVLINDIFYRVKYGKIANSYITEFYHSIK